MRYKISIVGSAGCGKTTLAHCLAYGHTAQAANEALNVHKMSLHAGDNVFRIALWDTMKGEYMDNISSLAYKSASICLVVFDFVSRASFSLASQYVQKVLGFEPSLSIVFVATKCDQVEIHQKIAVTHEEARAFAALYNASIFFVCGLTGVGIKQLLGNIATILSQRAVHMAQSVLSLEDLEVAQPQSRCYC